MRSLRLAFDMDQLIHEDMVNFVPLERAVGYLSTWALTAYSFAVIVPDGDGDLVANYYKNPPELSPHGFPTVRPDYQIGAVYDHEAQTYSFHS